MHGAGAPHRDLLLVGRERELSRTVRAIDDHGRGVVVAGSPGVGKSHLLREAALLLSERNWTPLRARGDTSR